MIYRDLPAPAVEAAQSADSLLDLEDLLLSSAAQHGAVLDASLRTVEIEEAMMANARLSNCLVYLRACLQEDLRRRQRARG